MLADIPAWFKEVPNFCPLTFNQCLWLSHWHASHSIFTQAKYRHEPQQNENGRAEKRSCIAKTMTAVLMRNLGYTAREKKWCLSRNLPPCMHWQWPCFISCPILLESRFFRFFANIWLCLNIYISYACPDFHWHQKQCLPHLHIGGNGRH